MKKWRKLTIGMLAMMLVGSAMAPQSVCAADTGNSAQSPTADVGNPRSSRNTGLLQKGESKGIALTSAVFQDENVLKAVKEYDRDGDGYLSEFEVPYSIWINERVEDVSGLEKLTTLESVSLYDCACTSIKLGKGVEELYIYIVESAPSVRISGSGLQYIRISAKYDTSYETVDVSACSQLESLESSVEFSALKLSKNSNELKKLKITGSALTSLNLKNARNLQTLTVAYNSQLKKINLSKNTKLEKLDCSCNELTKLDCSKNIKLTSLYCYHNKLTSLKVSKATALKDVDCHHNELSSLNFSKNKALTRVDCYENPLQELYIKNKTNALNEISVIPEIVSVESKKPGKLQVVLKSQNNGHQYLVRANWSDYYSKELDDIKPSGEIDVYGGSSYYVDVFGGKKYNNVNVYTDIVTHSSSVYVEKKMS